MATVPARILVEGPPLRRPSEDEVKQAIEICHRIGTMSAEGVADVFPSVRLSIRDSDGSESEMELPPLARAILEYALAKMAMGNGMVLTPIRQQFPRSSTNWSLKPKNSAWAIDGTDDHGRPGCLRALFGAAPGLAS